MNYALIFAGGVGQRMNSKARPKQFLEIHGKPIIIHTIEYFEEHSEIDAIALIVVAEWLEYTKKLLRKYNVQKVKMLLAGGKTAMDTQRIGLESIREYEIQNGTSAGIVLIHDGVRPLIRTQLISDCIKGVKKYGSAVTIAPATETIVQIDDESNIRKTIRRSECMLARAPQAFYVEDILKAHEDARVSGNYDYIDSASLMLGLGKKVHTVEGPVENLKVTTTSDFYICRSLLDAREAEQLNGF